MTRSNKYMIIQRLAGIGVLTLLFSLSQSCSVMCKGFGTGCKKEESSLASEAEAEVTEEVPEIQQPVTHKVPVGLPPQPTKEVIDYVVGEGFALTRLTPEQISNHLRSALGYFYGQTDAATQVEIDFLQILYGVSLGGIDFTTTSRRDLGTKAQTLLVARVIAWDMSRISVFTDLNRATDAKKLFTLCDMTSDRPYMPADSGSTPAQQATIMAGEVRWTAQVEDMFWRFYSRPATASELAAVKTAFVTSFSAEGDNVTAAWTTIIYALVSSQEFWNL